MFYYFKINETFIEKINNFINSIFFLNFLFFIIKNPLFFVKDFYYNYNYKKKKQITILDKKIIHCKVNPIRKKRLERIYPLLINNISWFFGSHPKNKNWYYELYKYNDYSKNTDI